ncbi:hypothetical protein HRbin22_02337 [Candidatus Thermoflexus japonica]|uniref:Uncharacterized protein n=1 Tax=Candidatus Thermoflexus japonica TaxID=2035417 RepID=A0A2H5Y9E2_9CHLR|nr:hypothetical protein HRbin22_02337 [Candidatus Thermoflexus japonica]
MNEQRPIQPIPTLTTRSGRWGSRAIPLTLLALCFALDLIALPPAFVHNDEAHGAIVLIYNLPDTLRAVARDSHPPLYYVLLWGWLRLVPHPFALKFVSPFFALLALALVYRLVRAAAGQRAAALAMLLLGLNPLFFAMATIGRMYSMAIAWSAMGAWQAMRGRDRAWLLSAWGLTLTHFYGAFFLPAQRLLTRGPRSGFREALLLSLAVLPVTLWSIGALGPSLAHTVRTLGRIPIRPTPVEVLANLMGAMGIGIGADGRLGWIGAMLTAFGIGAALSARTRRLGLAMAIPIGIGLALATRFPFYAARYFSPILPFYAWMLAAGWSRRWRRILTSLFLISGVYGIGRTWAVYGNAPIYVEAQRELYAALHALAHPADRLVFHGYWNQAEMALFYPETRPRLRSLEDLTRSGAPLREPTWLIGVTFFQELYRPAAEALARQGPFDRHAWYPMAEVFRFIPWPDSPSWQPVHIRFEDGIRLEAVALPDPIAEPRGSVRIGLRWQAERPVARRYVVFAHLWDAEGRYRAGTDREPEPPTATWEAGLWITQTMAISVPPFLPAGRYRVVVGLYEPVESGWRRLRAETGADAVAIGLVEVRPFLEGSHRPGRALPIGITMLESGAWRTEIDGAPRWRVHLVWRADRPIADDTHRLLLRFPDGTVRAMTPPEGWFPGARSAGEIVAEIWEWREPLAPGRYQVFWEGGGDFALLTFRVPPDGYRWNYDWIFLNRLPR